MIRTTALNLALLLAGLAPQGAVAAQPPADTVLAAVDGARMRLVVAGAGRPSIVLEAGAGGDHRTWSAAENGLARLGRVVSYDRLGAGASGGAARPRTAAVIAEQLRAGLRAAGVEPPFLLVGHSYGGALVRVFAARYPAEVLGLVLVDPAQEDFYLRAAREAAADYVAQLEEDLRWAESSPSSELRRELLAYETSMAQARVARLPAGRPVVLLSARRMELTPPLRRIWLEEQGRWAAAVGARRVFVEHGHRIPQERPGAVVEAVASILRDERVKCRLTSRCS